MRKTLEKTTAPSEYREYSVAEVLSQNLVLEVPAPPKVRAAAYRALAEWDELLADLGARR
ncbi:hypothetical protein OG589_37975 [Sphaerisporangium sp. NBC_01403]|uniref:hypothetical protein n=1 Tax=Sphaerisporangium sp. NBC_01403 TaxID=2903599 RepID=UPI00324DE5B7